MRTSAESLRVREQLERIAGVSHALIDTRERRIDLMLQSDVEMLDAITAQVGAALAQTPMEQYVVVPSFLQPPQPHRRVRLADVHLTVDVSRRIRATVVLEWKGLFHRGVVEAVGTQPAESRCVAEATLRALEATVRGRIALELIGVKDARIFDEHIVFTLVSGGGAGRTQPLVGVASQGQRGESWAAAASVLNATNSMMGALL